MDSFEPWRRSNRYTYVCNNPINHIDPLGLIDWREIGLGAKTMGVGALEMIVSPGVAMLDSPVPGLADVAAVGLFIKGGGDALGGLFRITKGLGGKYNEPLPRSYFDAIAKTVTAGRSKQAREYAEIVAAGGDLAVSIAITKIAPPINDTFTIFDMADLTKETTDLLGPKGGSDQPTKDIPMPVSLPHANELQQQWEKQQAVQRSEKTPLPEPIQRPPSPTERNAAYVGPTKRNMEFASRSGPKSPTERNEEYQWATERNEEYSWQ